MLRKRRKSQESAEPEKPEVRKKIIQSTQKQLPIKDFANGTIITDDNRILKMLEVTAIPFNNQKVNQQNMTRQYFENFLKKLRKTTSKDVTSLLFQTRSQVARTK